MRRIADFFRDVEKRGVLFLILSGVSLAASFLFKNPAIHPAWIAVLLCGIPILIDAGVGLFTRFDVKADVLVSLALVASIAIGEVFAAGEVAFIMAIGAMLEQRTVKKARAGIEKLVRLTPRTARVVTDGEERVIPAEEVRAGDILSVHAGETIPVDGMIVSGESTVDQSVMTGESMPVDKCAGDTVKSGTVNRFGSFTMRAERVGEDSSLQRMIRLVESADAGKAKIVGIADRWATWIVIIALVSAIATWIITGEAIRAVTILVVFCPCALVLATPTAIMAGIGNATRSGVLIRQGDALERLAQVQAVAFDKTGTLTFGRPAVAHVAPLAEGETEDSLMYAAAAAELRAEHPLGNAIVAHYRALSSAPLQPEQFQLLPGRGVTATLDGRSISAGNEKLMEEKTGARLPEEALRLAARYKEQGCTVMYVARDNTLIGMIALSDTIRPDAGDTVNKLQNIGVKSLLLTGDIPQAAQNVAALAGVQDVRANLLPEDKLNVIRRLQLSGELVCMVGDGINDAPALKAAHVGVAMGGVGSDIAIEAADIALVRDDIKALPHLFLLAKKTMRVIRVNLILSMALNFASILLAMLGILGPVAGALLHNIGSVAVVLHSATLLKWRKRGY
ncbi:MAG TPA: cation-translocating P-type ATPase [Feifaniaceae bacterium]|nr:cation-translocating P-type ATPase [Feifaniaceae bacterium]